MTKEQVKILEQALVQACDARLAVGGRIISGMFRGSPQGLNFDGTPVPSADYCPLACLGIAGFKQLDLLTEKLGFQLSKDDAEEFVVNFDDTLRVVVDGPLNYLKRRWTPIARMARRLRKKYITHKVST